jgi:transcription elongation factor Elf1
MLDDLSVDLGFGSVEGCQSAIGIECVACEYAKMCIGEPDDEVTKYFVGVCPNCGNDYEVDVRVGEEPVLLDTCGNCGCEFEWKEWKL